ncbi:unnamed protein product [Enterobius vermicularis]|uniref:SERPIN domain-containing protein n=1 Tax=Enterobius vermicularis TaxID=51028 RepID=A0A0N4VI33_ENTVE|nr:unnamed protein product [Enterobius vermicularis]
MKPVFGLWIMIIFLSVACRIIEGENSTVASAEKRNLNVADPVDQAKWNFALRVWRQSGPTSNSAVISPVFAALFIAIARLGSDGDTADEIMHTLRYPDTSGENVTDDKLLASWKEEFDELLSCPLNSLFCINAVHLLQKSNETVIKEMFLEKLRTFLNGKLQVENYDDFMERITSEEFQAARPKSERIVGEMSFSTNSFVFLVNASFYDQRWKNKFKLEKTITRDFGPNRESVAKLPFMPGEVFTSYFFGDNEDVQILGIPFADNVTCMYIFLPLDKNGLAKFELESEGDRLLQMIMKLRFVDVEVEALKFEMSSKVDLTPGLRRLDFRKAVSPEANFAKMLDSYVFIQNITLNTIVRVDEDGFKAEELNPTTKLPVPKVLWQGPHYRFVAYHPFLFIIAKNQKQMLYIGRYL